MPTTHQYYQENKEKIQQKNNEWRRSHPQKMREYRAVWAVRYREQIKAHRQTKEWKEKQRVQVARYKVKNPEKRKAHNAIHNAVRDGRIKKPDTCSNCGSTGVIQGHHPDYKKLLEVIWLCLKCHKNIHLKPVADPEEK